MSVTAPIQMVSVMGTSAQLLAAVGVADGQGKKADGDADEDEISHALVSRGFDRKPSGVVRT
jgi:hypothetical protein